MKKPARPAKPVKPGLVKKPAAAAHHAPKRVTPKIRASRHAAAVKAAKTRAANLKKHPRRRLPPSDGVACCASEALAASLRRSGWPVRDTDVLGLYWRTAGDADAGASILGTLEAAAEFGLAGVRPLAWAAVEACDFMPALMPGLILGLDLPGPHAVLDTGSEWISWGQAWPVSAFPDVVIEEAWSVTWPEATT